MKYIFFGTPEFAAIILEKLVKADMVPAAVVTNPDRPAGRKKIMTPPPVKLKAAGSRLPIPLVQPERLDGACASALRKINADLGVLAAYGKIIPREIIDVFPKGIIVVHPSLLPRYRGATPIQTAILNGDAETGTTLFVMDEQVDHGKIIAHVFMPIAHTDTYETLSKKLAEVSADVLIDTIPQYIKGEIQPRVQNEAQATYTKKIISEDGFVNLKKDTPEKIERMVRALNPEPGVYAITDGKRMKILDAEARNGRLILKKIQYAGKKPIATAEYISS